MKQLIFSLLFLLSAVFAVSQTSIKTYFGQSYYQGDLSPMNHWTSYSEGSTAFGVGISYQISKYFSFGLDVFNGKLKGDDRKALDEDRRIRNLRFQNVFVEANVVVEFNITQLFRDSSYTAGGLDLYYKTGIGVIRSNPTTELNGQEYILREYGTEGQYLSGASGVYGLHHLTIPFGIGCRFAMTPRVIISFEAVLRATFTDYLDDVSSTYPDLQMLKSSNHGMNAVLLSYRSRELEPSDFPAISGTARGDASNSDWYSFVGFSIGYQL